MILLAKLAAPRAGEAMVVVFPLLIIAAIGGLVWLIMKAVKHDRELTHQERLRCIDLGVQPDAMEHAKKYQQNVFWTTFWIGGAVPTAAIYFATTALRESEFPTALKTFIWSGAMVIAVAGVVSATVLMFAARPKMTRSAPPLPRTHGRPKSQEPPLQES
jgi:hypothetical protein